MNKDDLIELTNKLYRLTLLFPQKEPLRYKIREISTKILEAFIVSDKKSLIKNIEIIKAYFAIVKWQNWVSYFDVLDIVEKYDKIKDNLEEIVQSSGKEQKLVLDAKLSKDLGLDPRKEKILSILKKKEKVQVWEIKEILPEISKRTLRRDFEHLLKQGLVERIGQRNETFYKLS